MENKPYIFVCKTGDAELRALENVDTSSSFLPIIELTRGRKSKNDKIGSISKRLDKIKSIFKNKEICIDLTTSDALSNEEINRLYLFDDGYKNWIDFIKEQKKDNIFKSIYPTILVNTEDTNFNDNLIKQVDALTAISNKIFYRNSLIDDGCYEDINVFKNILEKKKVEFYFIIDCEYIAPGAWRSFADKAIKRIEKIRAIYADTKFIIASTSFPNNTGEIGNESEDTFRLSEIDLFNNIDEQNKNAVVLYADYASINPIRNDTIVMANGWRPRIDVPLADSIYYYRERKGKNEYSETYTIVAKKVINDSRFPYHLDDNWGIKQIKICALGNAPGANPSFWISVRMNIHIAQQLNRLQSL